MYSDPSQIRSRSVKLSFNEREAALIDAWIGYTGGQKAAFIRELLLEQARLDIAAQLQTNEGPQRELFGN